MIKLSKKDTLKLIWLKNKVYRFNIQVKFESKCLNCLDIIYVSYKQFSVNNIYCKNCKNCLNDKSSNIKLIQAQYMRRIKENQLNLITKFLKIEI